jgi:hypothetical protein
VLGAFGGHEDVILMYVHNHEAVDMIICRKFPSAKKSSLRRVVTRYNSVRKFPTNNLLSEPSIDPSGIGEVTEIIALMSCGVHESIRRGIKLFPGIVRCGSGVPGMTCRFLCRLLESH